MTLEAAQGIANCQKQGLQYNIQKKTCCPKGTIYEIPDDGSVGNAGDGICKTVPQKIDKSKFLLLLVGVGVVIGVVVFIIKKSKNK